MTKVHVMLTSAAPMATLDYTDVEAVAHDMSQGIYIKLSDGREIILNPLMVFALVIGEEEDDKGRT